MNDLISVSLSQGCEIVMFAHDILMFKPISGEDDLVAFQSDIDRIANWMTLNHLSLNPQKTKLIILSCSGQKSHPVLLLNGAELERVSHFNYLGIWVSDDLTWNNHIEAICCRHAVILGTFSVHFPPLPPLLCRQYHPSLPISSHPTP